MKLKNTLINFKIKKTSIAICTIAVAGIIGFYSFLGFHDINENSENSTPLPVSDQIRNNVPAPSKSNASAYIDTDTAKQPNEQLNSKKNDFTDINQNQGEALQELFSGPEPGESSESNERLNLKELFKDSVINKHTLRVTQMIQNKFSDSAHDNLEDLCSHYSQVEDYLKTQLDDEAKVEEFLNFYKKYTEYEIAQVRDPNSLWLETPENPEEAIRLNNEKQQYHREVFGREVADTLWGDESKIAEYKMKELEILRTDIYSAQVKEQLINDLREQTFGDEDSKHDTDYNAQLYLKLAIYSDELMEMTAEERDEKIKEFRNEIFPPDKLKFLEFLEGVVETDSEETNNSEQDAF